MNQFRRRPKLWLGVGFMFGAILVWATSIWRTVGHMLTFPREGAPPGQMEAWMNRSEPREIFAGMLIAYAVSGMMLLGGVVLTVMGLIDYFAEVKRRD